jgi:excinuclease ABC subunit B
VSSYSTGGATDPFTLAPGRGVSVARHTVSVMRPTTDLQRRVAPFEVMSDFQPSGDQPEAIAELARRIRGGATDVVLLGATGTGKSATTPGSSSRCSGRLWCWRPTRHWQRSWPTSSESCSPTTLSNTSSATTTTTSPRPTFPQTDTYIEKDSSINEEVERLRHSATNSLLTRRDVIVVASVSCIYGLGTPQEYVDRMVRLRVGQELERDQLLRGSWDAVHPQRHAFTRGTFRVRGDTVEIIPMYEELAVRIEFFGDEIERLYTLHPLTGEIVREEQEMYVFPASHYVAGPERMERAIGGHRGRA